MSSTPSSTCSPCARCGRPCSEDDLSCALCGNLLRAAAASSRAKVEAAGPPPSTFVASFGPTFATSFAGTRETRTEPDDPRVLGLPEPLFFLALGLVTAPLFSVTPLVRLIGWFLSALVHEMGHSLVAWAFGMPSFPAISLTAEAAAIHGDQVVPLVLLIWAGASYAAWRIPHRGLRFTILPLAAIVYPVLAFTGAREALHLFGGHLGELAFAVLCLQRALSGGFTESSAERALYGTVGWYLVGANLFLSLGLVFSASKRALYASNGSFGILNDYLRLAEDVLGCPLEVVAFGMSLVAVAAPAAALVWWRLGRRDD